jgi:Protein of unknown function (DUF1566)
MKISRSARWPLGLALVLVASLVHANAPATQYTVANGTVTDTKTGLVWQQVDDGNMYTWPLAKTHCTGLSLNGGGWRVPTVKELQTIVDDEVTTPPTIAPVFTSFGRNPSVATGFYWSTTPVVGAPSLALVVEFDDGNTNANGFTNACRVRCVR